ncbi:hypothetical protein KJZ99_00150 [bacterium]|nr:hypothetical protein [bacterium]
MARPNNPIRKWTPEEIEYLWLACVVAVRAGVFVPVTEIAAKLNRSRHSVAGRLQWLRRERWKFNAWPTDYDYMALHQQIKHRARAENDNLILGLEQDPVVVPTPFEKHFKK